MMYVHYCKNCQHIHMLNGHKVDCPRCEKVLNELKLSFLEYSDLKRAQREELLLKLLDEKNLTTMSTRYRMSKYTKYYKPPSEL